MAKLTVTGTGDSLFVTEFPKEYDRSLQDVADFIGGCQVRLTNLETNLSDFEFYGGAYSGGTWLNTRRSCLKDLMRFGFNYYGTANNHCMDYTTNGLLSTIATLDAQGLAHSGTGRSLPEAAAPAILNIEGQKVAVFAVDTSFNPASKAGMATHKFPGRPGVNFLAHDDVYKVTPEEMQQLRAIGDSTRINFTRQFSIASGYTTPDPEGVYVFGGKKFTTDQDVPDSSCKESDLKRITDAIADARKDCAAVFMLVHCHDDDRHRVENPPAYLRQFAHACIDAGAAAIFGGGCHRLRGMEMFKGFPIFYSLGDFIYQGPLVEHLPADFMEAYKVNIFASAKDALLVRSRGNTVGLHCVEANYQTLLPKLTYEDGKLTGLQLLPIYLNFDRKDEMNGLPQKATPEQASNILRLMNELSAPYGVTLKQDGEMLVLADASEAQRIVE